MSNLIQWPTAKYWTSQWNPVIGCKPCSPACEHCYAAAWAKRFGQSFEPHLSSQARPPRKGVVFVGNMTDLFGDWMWPDFGRHGYYIMRSPEALIALACGKTHSDATYLWLTKRTGNMCDALKKIENLTTFQHYFGFTAENQEWYDFRFKAFRRISTKFKGWLSAEPLLGPINLGLDCVYPPEAMPFQWLAVGCESGPNRRPCKIEWVESIVEQCRTANVPVFVKQICLPNGRFTNKIEEFPKHLQIRQVPWAK